MVILPTNSRILFKFVDKNAKTNSQLTGYICYLVVGVEFVALAMGFATRKLAGLEAALVVQLAWLNLLWVNCHFSYIMLNMSSLKYTMGYAIPFNSTLA